MAPEAGAALMVVSDGLSSTLWQQAVVGFGHQSPLGRLYLFFEVRPGLAKRLTYHLTCVTTAARAGWRRSFRPTAGPTRHSLLSVHSERGAPGWDGPLIASPVRDLPLSHRRLGLTLYPSFLPLGGR